MGCVGSSSETCAASLRPYFPFGSMVIGRFLRPSIFRGLTPLLLSYLTKSHHDLRSDKPISLYYSYRYISLYSYRITAWTQTRQILHETAVLLISPATLGMQDMQVGLNVLPCWRQDHRKPGPALLTELQQCFRALDTLFFSLKTFGAFLCKPVFQNYPILGNTNCSFLG